MNHCIIFDLDGTLVDSLEDLADAVNYMRGEYGLAALHRPCPGLGDGRALGHQRCGASTVLAAPC